MHSRVPKMLHFLEFLYASRALLARLHLQKVTKTIAAEMDSHKELVVHVRRSIRRPWRFVDFQMP